jgi:hypothetical protein
MLAMLCVFVRSIDATASWCAVYGCVDRGHGPNRTVLLNLDLDHRVLEAFVVVFGFEHALHLTRGLTGNMSSARSVNRFSRVAPELAAIVPQNLIADTMSLPDDVEALRHYTKCKCDTWDDLRDASTGSTIRPARALQVIR